MTFGGGYRASSSEPHLFKVGAFRSGYVLLLFPDDAIGDLPPAANSKRSGIIRRISRRRRRRDIGPSWMLLPRDRREHHREEWTHLRSKHRGGGMSEWMSPCRWVLLPLFSLSFVFFVFFHPLASFLEIYINLSSFRLIRSRKNCMWARVKEAGRAKEKELVERMAGDVVEPEFLTV